MSASGPDRLLDELLLDWEESLAAGTPLSAADLCRDCPELAGALEHKISRLKTVDRFLFSTDHADLAQPGQGASGTAKVSHAHAPPGYELVGELGRGGMGVVYKARQKSLGRFVAVKTLAGSRWLQPGSAARLRQEAQALSRLNHPYVVQVLDVVETEHALSIVLEYVEGESLAQRLNGSPLPAKEAAQLALTLSRALTAVHEQGLLHRDIKPGNVLLGRSGEIKISDFGLAKETGDVEGLTMTGELLGSPRYMSPEQAEGRTAEIDVRTDIYGLGATLYEMLTGRAPFQAASHAETLRQVIESEPVSPRLLNSAVPRDLETICLKCLEKRPDKRYANSEQLANDLERFLSGRPTLARPISGTARAVRWFKRHPAQAIAGATVVVAVAAVISISTWYAVRLSGAERETDLKKQALDAEVAKGRLQNFNLLAARIRERSLNRPRGWPADNLADLKQLGPEAADDETRRMLRGEALRALCAPQLELVGVVADEFDNYGLTYSPDGRLLAAGINRREDGVAVVVLYDADTREELSRLAFPATSTWVGAEAKAEGVRSLLFAPDGSRLFVGSRTGMIHVWDLGAGQLERSWQGHANFVTALAIMRDHGVLASWSEDRTLRFWRLPVGQLLESAAVESISGGSLAARGTRVVFTSGHYLRAIDFDPDSGTVTTAWESHSAFAQQVAIFPDQQTLLCLGSILTQNALVDGKVVRRFTDSRHRLSQEGKHDLDISATGRWATSCGYDGVKLWDVMSASLIQAIPNAANQRVSAAFRPGSAELAVARDGRIEVWQIAESGVCDSDLRNSYTVEYADLSRDGRTLVGVTAPRDENGSAFGDDNLLVTSNGAPQRSYPKKFCGHPITVSATGQSVACSGLHIGEHSLDLFDVDEPELRRVVAPKTGTRSPAAAFSADQKHVWYASSQDGSNVGYIAGARTSDGSEEFRWANERSEREARRSEFFSIAVGTDFVTASSVDETVRFFDPVQKRLIKEVLLPGRTVDSLCLTGGETALVCGTREGRLLVLNVPDGTTLLDLPAHDDWITAVCASAEGLVCSACRDGTLAAWQWADGQLHELFRLGPLSRGIKDTAISEDGRLLMILVESETGVRLLRIDVLRHKLEELRLNWPGGEVPLPHQAADEPETPKRAALLHPRQPHAGYFFRGDKYQRYNFDLDRVDEDERKIGVDG